MRMAWLLLVHSGRSSWNRLGLTAAAVALGMLLLLTFMIGVNGLINRNTLHSQWRYDLAQQGEATQPIDGVAPLKAKIGIDGNLDKWQNEDITTVSLRATDATSPELKGLATPKEGEYYVSRGLDAVIRAHPEAGIGQRFGEKEVGIIPDSLSASPDALEVIRGMSEHEVNGQRIVPVYTFTSQDISIFSGDIGMILIIGGSILLLPIITFISIATQLGSAQREKRYAALRLVGATRRQVMSIMAIESLAAAGVGIILGTIAHLAILPLLADYKLDGMRFWQNDLTMPVFYYILAFGLTMALCLYANWWGMRHVQLSPLGVARSQKLGKKPRAWRVLPLVLGIAVFGWLSLPQGQEWTRSSSESTTPIMLLIVGVMSSMFGLLLAGPWLTNCLSRVVAWRTRSVTTLLASKRIAVQSKQVFRSVSGVVLALFAGSFYLTGVSGIDQLNADALSSNGYSQLKDNTAIVVSEVLPTGFDAQLREQPYVQSVSATGVVGDRGNLMDCQTIAAYTKHTCPEGSALSDMALVNFDTASVASVKVVREKPTVTGTSYLILLDSNEHLDQLRTFVANRTGIHAATLVVSGTYAQIPILNPVIKELAGLAYVGMAVTLCVAIASLIVSTIGGLLERKRSFVTLRLGGMTVTQMKRTVMIESLIPLIAVSLLASGLGVWTGAVFVSSLSDSANPTLTPLYFAIVLGALVVAVLAIRSVVPMLERITQPEENRTE